MATFGVSGNGQQTGPEGGVKKGPLKGPFFFTPPSPFKNYSTLLDEATNHCGYGVYDWHVEKLFFLALLCIVLNAR